MWLTSVPKCASVTRLPRTSVLTRCTIRTSSAVAHAHDGGSLPVCQPARDDRVDARENVGGVPAAPVAAVRVEELLRVAGRPTRVDAQHGDASGREQLPERIEAVVEAEVGTAVDLERERRRARGFQRPQQQPLDLPAIGALPRDRLGARERQVGEPAVEPRQGPRAGALERRDPHLARAARILPDEDDSCASRVEIDVVDDVRTGGERGHLSARHVHAAERRLESPLGEEQQRPPIRQPSVLPDGVRERHRDRARRTAGPRQDPQLVVNRRALDLRVADVREEASVRRPRRPGVGALVVGQLPGCAP
jgi:hypothetical protein